MNIIKHKEKFPWELHPPGSSRANRGPEGFNRKEYNAHLEADAFIWMIYWSINPDHEFDLESMINYWWSRLYNKPFPEEGGIAYDFIDRIFCRLIDIGHEAMRIEPQESDYELPKTLLRSEYWDKAKNKKIIYIQKQEAEMAKITLKKSTNVASSKKGIKSPSKENKKITKTASSDDAPAWITGSKPGTKAHESKVKVCELLEERKYTDDEIALMVESELEYKINADRVAFYRKVLNKGQFASLGFDAPEEPIQPIEKDDSIPTKSGKKASKESTVKPSISKVKGSVPKIAVKKKLILKKK